MATANYHAQPLSSIHVRENSEVWLLYVVPHFMEEGSTSQNHGELTAVVGVVEPATMSHIIGVEATREAHQLISSLTPHSVCEV